MMFSQECTKKLRITIDDITRMHHLQKTTFFLFLVNIIDYYYHLIVQRYCCNIFIVVRCFISNDTTVDVFFVINKTTSDFYTLITTEYLYIDTLSLLNDDLTGP